jgi:predicted RNA-binding protein YlqC (UPF0109 family)
VNVSASVTFLRSILDTLLPSDEHIFVIETISTGDRSLVLIIDPETPRGRAIVMGKGGATISSIRRLLQAAAYKWQITKLDIELKGDTKRESEEVQPSS